MIYRTILSTPRGRFKIGFLQMTISVLVFCLDFPDLVTDFFMPMGKDYYSEEYVHNVRDLMTFPYVVVFFSCFVYFLRGMHKIVTWEITGHPGLEEFQTSFWASVTSLSWWINFLTEYRPSDTNYDGRKSDNVDSIVDYVEMKNKWSSREKSAERYASINNISMMDKNTRDYVNSRLTWMSRENGYKYIKGLNKKD